MYIDYSGDFWKFRVGLADLKISLLDSSHPEPWVKVLIIYSNNVHRTVMLNNDQDKCPKKVLKINFWEFQIYFFEKTKKVLRILSKCTSCEIFGLER